MAQPAVVVAFTSRCGTTETLAHAAAVGVVNSRALPRLRRLADDGTPTPPDCAATIQRMQKEYVLPTESDITGSPALIVVPSAGMTPSSDAWQPFMAMPDRLASTGGLRGKLGAVVDAGDRQTIAAFSLALAQRGFTLHRRSRRCQGARARSRHRTPGARRIAPRVTRGRSAQLRLRSDVPSAVTRAADLPFHGSAE